jgi:hypothetical protein
MTGQRNDTDQDQPGRRPSRALVVLERQESAGHERPLSGFLAQLIACDRRLPAYRSARLAEPERAISAYGSQPGGAPLSFSRLV